MITASRFLGYDKNEYGDLIVNRKEAEIVSLTFDLYLMNVGSSKKPYKEKQRGSAELLHFGKSRTNCIAGGMGKGAGSQGTEKA